MQRKADLAAVPGLRARIAELESQGAADYEKRIENLKKLIEEKDSEWATQLSTCQKDLKLATSEVISLRGRIMASDERVTELAREKSGLEARVLALTNQLTNMTQERDVQLAAKEDANEKIAALLELMPEASYSTLVDYIALRLGSLAERIEKLIQNENGLARLADEQASKARIAESCARELERQVRDLTPLLPPWAQWLAGLVLTIAVALIAHQSGFQAGLELGSSAGLGVAR